jgi:hypothetical protein
MPQTEQIVTTNETPHANGGSTLHDLFALTDEQILEIEPEAQDVQVSESQATASGEDSSREAHPSLPAGSARAAADEHRRLEAGATSTSQSSNAAQPVSAEATPPPQWLAERMADPQSGAEARELWNGVQQARQETAAYREVFAKPEDARAAAQRARVLDDIDRAYFAGDANQRTQLAAMMLREDPAAFREMVFEGLRALEKVGAAGTASAPSSASVPGTQRTIENTGPAARQEKSAPAATQNARASSVSGREAELAAYASFEKAANEDLEKSVGGAIARTIEQALPNLARANESTTAGARSIVPLQERIGAAIRADVEAALKSDRQLGEQVAQILSARRLDGETRAQVVRIIGERAAQLVPGAAKRALNDWTQTTLAAHGARRARTETASFQREVAASSSSPGMPREQQAKNQQQDTQRQNTRPSSSSNSRRVDYRKLSDEQILEL